MAYLGNNNLPFDPTRTAAQPRDAERFSGNGSTTTFTLSRTPPNGAIDVTVYVENVAQEPITAYDVLGTSLVFTEAPPTGTYNIYVIYRNFQSGAQITMPDGSVSYNKLANNLRLFTTDNLTPNGNNSVFTLSEPPADANTVFVTVDGIGQRAPVHYTTSGSTITFTSAPPVGSNVHVRHLGFRTTQTLTAIAANTAIPQPNIASPTIIGGSITGTTINSAVISAASLTGNTAVPSGSQLFIQSPSINFDLKGVPGAADTLLIRSTYAGTTYAGIQMDYLGRVARPYQPAFHIRGNSQTSRSSGEYSVVEGGNTISTNVGSHWNNTTKRFVVPIAGIYHFVMTVTGNGSGFNAGMSIRKNGIEHNYQLNYNGYYQSGTCSAVIECAVNDYVEAFVVWNNGVTGSIYSGSFTGFLL